MVQVRGYIQHASAPTPSGGVQITSLPVGYRPLYLTPVNVAYSPATTGYTLTSLNVMTDGGILYYGSTNAITFLVFTFMFMVT
jgi:hypothetical protein